MIYHHQRAFEISEYVINCIKLQSIHRLSYFTIRLKKYMSVLTVLTALTTLALPIELAVIIKDLEKYR